MKGSSIEERSYKILGTNPDSSTPEPIKVLDCFINRAIATDLPAPVPFLPFIPHVSGTLLIEIRLGYVLLAYSL